MKTESQTADPIARGRAATRPYSAPVLKEFGSVTALTQAGTSGTPEGARMNPARRI